jgi:tol-pal system protein YbgF
MKIPYFLALTACIAACNVYAESTNLPPVLDDSIYTDTIPAPQSTPQPVPPQLESNSPESPAPQAAPPQLESNSPELPAPSYEGINDLDQIKTDMQELKNKVHEQESTIDSLRRSNDELHKKLTDAPTPKVSTKPKSKVSEHFELPKPPASNLSVTPKVEKPKTEAERYQLGSSLLKRGDYTQAIAEFQGLIKTYPTSKYADNSQYWIGVALMNKGDKKGAVQAFDRLARSYPKSEKVPEGLYKLALVLLSSNNKAKAKEYFNYVIQNYPGTNGAILAAKKKAQEKL